MEFKVVQFLAIFCYVSKVSGLRFCYFTNWAQHRPGAARFTVDNIDPFLCSHIVYAYAWLTGNQLTHTQDNDEPSFDNPGQYHRVVQLKEQNPELKVLLAVAGLDVGSLPFSSMLASPASRRQFIHSALVYLRLRDFDGIDLDLQYPGRRRGMLTDTQDFNNLLTEMRHSFREEANHTGQEELLITAVVPHGRFFTETGYDVQVVSSMLDYIFVMTYDFHGPWESGVGHPSPLHPRTGEVGENAEQNLVSAMNYWIALGVPRHKLVASVALYGRSYNLVDAGNHTLGVPDNGSGPPAPYTQEPGFIAYYEICDLLSKGAIRYWHNEHMVPYIVNGSTWIGYDDAKSIALKMRWMKNANLAGVMIWAMDLDDFVGNSCNQGVSPLLTTINLKLVDRKFNIADIKTRFATKHVRMSQIIDEVLRNQSKIQSEGHVPVRSNLNVPKSVKQIADSVKNAHRRPQEALHEEYADILKNTNEIISRKSNTIFGKTMYHPVLDEAIKHITTFQEGSNRQPSRVFTEGKQTSGDTRIYQPLFDTSNQLFQPAQKRPQLRLIDTSGISNAMPDQSQSVLRNTDPNLRPPLSTLPRLSNIVDRRTQADTSTNTVTQTGTDRVPLSSHSAEDSRQNTNNLAPDNINIPASRLNDAARAAGHESKVQMASADKVTLNNLPEIVRKMRNITTPPDSESMLLPSSVSFLSPSAKQVSDDKAITTDAISNNGAVSETGVTIGSGVAQDRSISYNDMVTRDSDLNTAPQTKTGTKVVYTGGMKMKSKSIVDTSNIVKVSPRSAKLRLFERVTSGTFTSTLKGTTIPTRRMDISNTLQDQVPQSQDFSKRKNTVKHINIPVDRTILRKENETNVFKEVSKDIKVETNRESLSSTISDKAKKDNHIMKMTESKDFGKKHIFQNIEKGVIPNHVVNPSNTKSEQLTVSKDFEKTHHTIRNMKDTTLNEKEQMFDINATTIVEVLPTLRQNTKRHDTSADNIIMNQTNTIDPKLQRKSDVPALSDVPAFSSTQLGKTLDKSAVDASRVDLSNSLSNTVSRSQDASRTNSNVGNIGLPTDGIMDDMTDNKSEPNRSAPAVNLSEDIRGNTNVKIQPYVSDLSSKQTIETVDVQIKQTETMDEYTTVRGKGVPPKDVGTINTKVDMTKPIKSDTRVKRKPDVHEKNQFVETIDKPFIPTSNSNRYKVPSSQNILKTSDTIKQVRLPITSQTIDTAVAETVTTTNEDALRAIEIIAATRYEINNNNDHDASLTLNNTFGSATNVNKTSHIFPKQIVEANDKHVKTASQMDISNALTEKSPPLLDVGKRNETIDNKNVPIVSQVINKATEVKGEKASKVKGNNLVAAKPRPEISIGNDIAFIVRMVKAMHGGPHINRKPDVHDFRTNQLINEQDSRTSSTDISNSIHEQVPSSKPAVKSKNDINHLDMPISIPLTNTLIDSYSPNTNIDVSNRFEVEGTSNPGMISDTEPLNIIGMAEAITRDNRVTRKSDVSIANDIEALKTIDALLRNILTQYHAGLKLKSRAILDSAQVIKTSPRKAKIRLFERVGAAVFSPTISQQNFVQPVEDNGYDLNTLGIKL